MSSNDKGVVNIKGKNYKLIVQRVNEFRQAHPEFGVETEVLHHDEIRIVAQVRILMNRAGFVVLVWLRNLEKPAGLIKHLQWKTVKPLNLVEP